MVKKYSIILQHPFPLLLLDRLKTKTTDGYVCLLLPIPHPVKIPLLASICCKEYCKYNINSKLRSRPLFRSVCLLPPLILCPQLLIKPHIFDFMHFIQD